MRIAEVIERIEAPFETTHVNGSMVRGKDKRQDDHGTLSDNR
jgi:hypothetical protein